MPKAAQFDVSMRLWVSRKLYERLAARAAEREWSIPQVIRHAIREAHDRGDLIPLHRPLHRGVAASRKRG